MALGKFYINKARAEIGSLFNTDNRYVYMKTPENSTSSDENLILPHLWTMWGYANNESGQVGVTYNFDGNAYVIGTYFGWPWGTTAIPFKLGVM